MNQLFVLALFVTIQMAALQPIVSSTSTSVVKVVSREDQTRSWSDNDGKYTERNSMLKKRLNDKCYIYDYKLTSWTGEKKPKSENAEEQIENGVPRCTESGCDGSEKKPIACEKAFGKDF